MRKWLFVGLAVALVLCSLLLPLLLPWHCPVNWAASERIKEGMTRAEVEAILGGPPGDYRTRPEGFIFEIPRTSMQVSERWYGDEGKVDVGFDLDNTQVCSVWFIEAERTAPRTIELVRWRVNRLKARWFP
jgi:hypothetical protein